MNRKEPTTKTEKNWPLEKKQVAISWKPNIASKMRFEK